MVVHTQAQLKRARQSLIDQGRDDAGIRGTEVHDEVDRMLQAVPPAPRNGKGAAPPPKAAAKGAARLRSQRRELPRPPRLQRCHHRPPLVSPRSEVEMGPTVSSQRRRWQLSPRPVVEIDGDEEEDEVDRGDGLFGEAPIAALPIAATHIAAPPIAATPTIIVKSASAGTAAKI